MLGVRRLIEIISSSRSLLTTWNLAHGKNKGPLGPNVPEELHEFIETRLADISNLKWRNLIENQGEAKTNETSPRGYRPTLPTF